MIEYKIKHKIVDCEKIESVTSHDLYPPPPLPLSQSVTLSQTPSPLWSVTYFMDGPLGIVYRVVSLQQTGICEVR